MTLVSTSLADPTGTNALVIAARWVEAALLGTVATTLAVLAVAAVGFLMLTGRLHIRRGTTVLIGCFLLFGASTIVTGLRGVDRRAVEIPHTVPVIAVAPLPLATALPSPPARYDPYAGAAVPTNR